MSDISSYSGLSGSGGGSALRIVGMATGLDVDGMVKKMMAAEQVKVDNVNKDKQYIQWKQEAYQDIIKDIKDLQSTYFNVTNSENNLLSAKSFSAFDYFSSAPSVATATANAGAVSGTYNVNVLKLAKSATISGTTLNSQVAVSNINDWKSKTITFDVNGTTTEVTIGNDFSGTSADDLSNYINNKITADTNLRGKLSMSIVGSGSTTYLKFNASSASNIKITAESPAAPSVLGALVSNTKIISTTSTSTKLSDLGSPAGTVKLSLSYNGSDAKTISLDSSKTVGDLITEINKATGGNVTAKLDELTGQFILQTKSTGSTATISIVDGSATPSDTSDDTTPELLTALGLAVTSKQGQDAKVEITTPDGNKTTVSQTSNIFTLNNISYNIFSEGSNTDITVTSSVDKVFNKIKGFIDKYNAIVEKISTKFGEKKAYDYKPLTAAQKKEMTEDEIKTWETKAQQGVLKNDNNLENMISELRGIFFKGVTGVGLTFGKKTLGLDTTNDASKGGRIEFIIDGEQILKDAIRDRGEDVMKLFTKSSSSTDAKTKYEEQGIFRRLSDILEKNVGKAGTTLNSAILTKYANKQEDFSITGTSGSNSLPDQIFRKDQLIKKLSQTLTVKQEKYYKMFSRLETSMNQINSQSAWLAQQFS